MLPYKLQEEMLVVEENGVLLGQFMPGVRRIFLIDKLLEFSS